MNDDLPEFEIDPVLQEFHERLRSLDQNCLTGLERGLAGMLEGDFTVAARTQTTPIEATPDDPQMRALIDLFNAMLLRSQSAVVAYERLREQLAKALGDQSCLDELQERLTSLDEHCLTDLDLGLQAMADGDLTRRAAPTTRPLVVLPGDRPGTLALLFNDMLARSRTALRSYDSVREDLRVALGDQSCLDELRLRLQSLNRHCLRDLEEGLEALSQGTTITRATAPVTRPLLNEDGTAPGELGGLFNRMLKRAQASVIHFSEIRGEPTTLRRVA